MGEKISGVFYFQHSRKLLNVNLDHGLGSTHDVLELVGFRVQADAVLVPRGIHGVNRAGPAEEHRLLCGKRLVGQ